jgi:transmembrane sensor
MSKAPLTEPQRQALQWLARLRDSESGDQEQQAFQDWLNGASEHAEAYRQVQQFWEQLGGLPDLAGNRLNAARGFVGQSQTARRRRNIILIVAAVAVGLGIHFPEPLQKLAAVRYQTALGERRTIELADGSRVELNTASTLRVARFGVRTVWLEQGEAWFDVKHDAAQPFEVRVGVGRIRDIGTRFNVVVERERTTVAVAEGEVALSIPGQPELSLVAGLQSGFNANGSLQTPGRNEAGIGAWREGMLIFKRQPLPEVLRQLARYHRVEFELPDAKLQTLTVSGRFSTTDLNESLSTLSNGLGVQIVRQGEGRILIVAKK